MMKDYTPGTANPNAGKATYWTRTKWTYYESASSNPIARIGNTGGIGSGSSDHNYGVAPCFSF